MASITLEDVTKVYGGGVLAVDRLSLEIGDGEFMVFVGPSGCGKSTALRCIAGLEEITSGTLRIGDRVVNNLAPRDRDIAMVFQNYALYPHMTVRENLSFGLQLRKVDKQEQTQRVERAAQMLGIEGFLDRKPAALSGGQRQRVAMGRAIVREPQAFLMDEPLSNLDAKLRVAMRASLNQLHKRLSVTTIYVTHDQIEAMTLGDRVAVLRDGRLQQVDTPQALFDHPVNLFVAGFIGSPAMNLVEAELARDGGVVATFGEHRLPVPDQVLGNRPGLDRYVGRNVVLGVRPSSFEDATLEEDMPAIEVSVGVTEELGSEINVIFTVDAPAAGMGDTTNAAERQEQLEAQEAGFTAGPGQSLWTARVSPKAQARVGERMRLAVDVAALQFFDPETGLVIGDDLAHRGAGAHVTAEATAGVG